MNNVARQKRSVGLSSFLKGSTDPKAGMPGCANFDHHYGGCLFQDVCLIQEGKRCGYFEKAVLPAGDSITRQKYEALTGAYIEGQVMNLCSDCGKSVPPRRRYCDKCKKKRRQKTNRDNLRKFRQKQRVSA